MPLHRVLCVDDNDDTCDLLKALLGRSDFEVVSVSNAADALQLIESEQFDLYILDNQLPGASGLSLCQEIRDRDKHVPIVIFSGHAFETDREAGLSAGANAYVTKPDVDVLAKTVKHLLEAPPNN